MMNATDRSRYAPTLVSRPSRNNNVLKVALASVAVLVALLLALVSLLLIGMETGMLALLVGFVAATLPVPVYITLVLWMDRYEPEPVWMIAAAFFWGALASFIIALFVNSVGTVLVHLALGEGAADFFGGSISAPIVEEGSKALALFILFFWKRDEFDGIVDGIIYASMVGLGFAMTENILYYGRAALGDGGDGTLRLFIIRGVLSPYAHPLFTSMTGIGIGLASQTKGRATRIIAPLCGLLLAMILHSTWNTSLYVAEKFENGLVALGMYFLVMVPIFFSVLGVIIYALVREGRTVRQYLEADVGRGLLTREEYNRVCTIRGRMTASFNALTRGGFTTWRARQAYNRTASELAFHRSRIARGLAAGEMTAAEREETYVRALQELRTRLGAH